MSIFAISLPGKFPFPVLLLFIREFFNPTTYFDEKYWFQYSQLHYQISFRFRVYFYFIWEFFNLHYFDKKYCCQCSQFHYQVNFRVWVNFYFFRKCFNPHYFDEKYSISVGEMVWLLTQLSINTDKIWSNTSACQNQTQCITSIMPLKLLKRNWVRNYLFKLICMYLKAWKPLF